MKPVALTIAGSDPSGGAGIQADLKTFHQFGVYGMSAITLLTAQNTRGVESVEVLRPELVAAQIDAVTRDIRPGAAKTGALGSAAVIEAVAARAGDFGFPLVVDPVMVSKHGRPLIEAGAREALVRRLLPLAYLVTPNRFEAAALSGIEVGDPDSAVEAAAAIAALGAQAVVVKGLVQGGRSLDLLWSPDRIVSLEAPWIETTSTHGAGCTFSAAITAELARGTELELAARRAKAYITAALRSAPGLGSGTGPVDHHARP